MTPEQRVAEELLRDIFERPAERRRRRRDTHASHDHHEYVAGCFRCDLRREEVTDADA